jgi:hypothetical protein
MQNVKRLSAFCILHFAFVACASRPHDAYLDRYFHTFPTRATAAGRHDVDGELEKLDAADRASWLTFNQQTRAALAGRTDLNSALLARAVDREIFALATLHTPERDPLYWTGIVSNSVVFLLVRDHRAEEAKARAKQIPRLLQTAEAALTADAAPELCAIAAAQARASAAFFAGGFKVPEAAAALEHFAAFLDALQKRATGSPRLGANYAEVLRLATGERDPDALLARAERDLAAKRKEAEAFVQATWPGTDLRAAFAKVEADNHGGAGGGRREDTTCAPPPAPCPLIDDWIAFGARLVDEAEAFTKSHDVVTLPEPRTLFTERSPSYFVGQSVGGVYPAGPYDPEARTLYFLPVPPDGATPAQREAFFRDFNDHFLRMITAHEILPGHYVQLKYAARNPHKVRAVFPDDVYVEGWGTFCERTMLDLGWGGPPERVAHLKKQMENIARTIVDIRVHTKGMTREEVVRFVTNEAMQGPQLAANMWTRSITSAPQITFYYLGYTAVRQLYDDVRAARGAAFHLRDFTDELMEIGPVPIEEVRRLMLPLANSIRRQTNAEKNPPRG